MKKLYTLLICAMMVSGAFAATPSLLSGRPACERKPMARTAVKAAEASQEETEWTEWESFGTGTLTMDDMFALFTGLEEWQGDFSGKTVDVRHAADNANVQQYRFNGVFNGADIVVDVDTEKGTLKMLPQNTKIDVFGEEILVADFATCYEILAPQYGQDVIDAYAAYNYFIPEMKRFYIYAGYLFSEEDPDVTAIGDLKFQVDGAADYVPKFEYSLFSNETKPATTSAAFPDETSYLEWAVFPGNYTSSKLQKLMDHECVSGKQTSAGAVALPELATGVNTLIGITYGIKSGMALEESHFSFTYTPDENGKWTSLGLTDITNDILEVINDEQPVEYKVELQQNNENPALYRLVNAHGAAYPANTSEADYDSEFNHYLTFDVSDPEDVKLIPAHVEKVLAAPVLVMSTADMLREAGKQSSTVNSYRGKFADGAITFPDEGLTLGCSNWTMFQDDLPAEGFVNTNLSGKFRIAIPDTGGIGDITADDVPAEYFSLQGIRLDCPARGTVVIERRGTAARKILVK